MFGFSRDIYSEHMPPLTSLLPWQQGTITLVIRYGHFVFGQYIGFNLVNTYYCGHIENQTIYFDNTLEMVLCL